MTTWRLAYENRFPVNATTGAPILNHFRAAQGAQTIQAGPVFTVFSGLPGFGIAGGRNITYRLNATLEDVIGIDVSMEFAFVGLFEGQTVGLFSTGSAGLSASMATTGPPAQSHTVCRLTLRLDDAVTVVDGLRFRSNLERRRVQVRWYSNGQLHVLLDGQLFAYENAFKPGHRFNLEDFSIGDVEQPSSGAIHAAITGFRLVELREESAVDGIGELLDPESIPYISDECVKVGLALQRQLVRDARKLMAAFNQSTTSRWREQDGGNPFSARAIAAHKSADRAAFAVGNYLSDGSKQSREEAFLHLKKLLEILAAEQPEEFREMVAKAKHARDELQAYCKDAVHALRCANPALFEKLDVLNAELDAVIESVGGGYGCRM